MVLIHLIHRGSAMILSTKIVTANTCIMDVCLTLGALMTVIKGSLRHYKINRMEELVLEKHMDGIVRKLMLILFVHVLMLVRQHQ